MPLFVMRVWQIDIAPGEFFLHLFFLAANNIHKGDHAADAPEKRDDSKRPADAMKQVAEAVGAYSEYKRPNDAARALKNKNCGQ